MKILLATDGSDTARVATEFLMGFPLPPATEVLVMTVIREVLRGDELQYLNDEQRKTFGQAIQEAEAEARRLLAEETARLQQAGLVAEGRVCKGDPAEEIVRLASDENCDLITVGSHGLSGVKRFLLGSVSDRVFEYASCSVLIVKPPADGAASHPSIAGKNYRWRLMLAYDDSPPARRAVELCASLPLASRATIKAVTVMPMIRMYRQDIRQQLSWIWQQKRQAAEKALEQIAAEVDWKGTEVQTEVIEESNASQAILDAAEAFDSDLLVVGHKGKKAFERFLLGSVTARLAHHATCPVLSVRNCG